LLLLLLAGCHGAYRDPSSAQPVIVTGDTTLGVGDTFEVRVFGESDLSGRYRVGGDGTIDFPLVGTIKVVGLIPSQAGAEIGRKLKEGILRSPQVSIFVVDQVSKKIHILGEVAKPGTFNYSIGMNIVEAISQAGGFTPLSAKNGTTVTRMENGKQIIYKVPAGDIGNGVAKNFAVRPGDIISVPERFF
jgi:polysaccharide export outer membrane protein